MKLFRHAVGKQLYVWSSSSSGKSRDVAVISAHGCGALVNGMDTAPKGIKLIFYCPHGYSLEDPKIETIVAGVTPPAIGPHKVQDYWLTKYQEAESKTARTRPAETYKDIYELPELFAKMHAFGEKYDKSANYADIKMDVVTIRNRAFHISPRLSWVLKELWANGYKYSEVHCSFCRPTFSDALFSLGSTWRPGEGRV